MPSWRRSLSRRTGFPTTSRGWNRRLTTASGWLTTFRQIGRATRSRPSPRRPSPAAGDANGCLGCLAILLVLPCVCCLPVGALGVVGSRLGTPQPQTQVVPNVAGHKPSPPATSDSAVEEASSRVAGEPVPEDVSVTTPSAPPAEDASPVIGAPEKPPAAVEDYLTLTSDVGTTIRARVRSFATDRVRLITDDDREVVVSIERFDESSRAVIEAERERMRHDPSRR